MPDLGVQSNDQQDSNGGGLSDSLDHLKDQLKDPLVNPPGGAKMVTGGDTPDDDSLPGMDTGTDDLYGENDDMYDPPSSDAYSDEEGWKPNWDEAVLKSSPMITRSKSDSFSVESRDEGQENNTTTTRRPSLSSSDSSSVSGGDTPGILTPQYTESWSEDSVIPGTTSPIERQDSDSWSVDPGTPGQNVLGPGPIPAPINKAPLAPPDQQAPAPPMQLADASKILADQADKTDDVYLHRKIGKNKMYSDAEKELAALDASQDAVKAVGKMRKMAVRTTATMDDYYSTLMVNSARAYALMRIQPNKGYNAHQTKSKAKSFGSHDRIAGQRVFREADQMEALSIDLNMLEDQVLADHAKRTAAVKAGRPIDQQAQKANTASISIAGEKVKEGFELRRAALKDVNTSKDNRKLLNKMYPGKGIKNAWDMTKNKVAGGIMEMATGGMLGKETHLEKGGRNVATKFVFPPYAKLKQASIEAKVIRSSGAMGGKKANMVYTALRVLSEVILPILRQIATTIALYATLIGIATGGAAIAVAAGAGTVAVLLSALKGLIDIGLGIWANAAAAKTQDKDARQNRIAKSEALRAGIGAAESIGHVALGTGITSINGDMVSPDTAMANRVEDFTNTTGLEYGDIGYADEWAVGKQDVSGLDDVGKLGRPLGKIPGRAEQAISGMPNTKLKTKAGVSKNLVERDVGADNSKIVAKTATVVGQREKGTTKKVKAVGLSLEKKWDVMSMKLDRAEADALKGGEDVQNFGPKLKESGKGLGGMFDLT